MRYTFLVHLHRLNSVFLSFYTFVYVKLAYDREVSFFLQSCRGILCNSKRVSYLAYRPHIVPVVCCRFERYRFLHFVVKIRSRTRSLNILDRLSI